MIDTTTFFARISSFFLAFWAYVLGMLYMKHKSTTLCDDLEVGIPTGKRRISGNFNTALPVVSDFCPIDGFVDICLNPDGKTTKTDVVSIATHNVPTKASVIETELFRPTVKIDRSVPVLFPVVPVIPKTDFVDNRSKHKVAEFDTYSLHEYYLQLWSRKRQDSFSDLLDLFPPPPTYVPHLHPVINEDVIPQTVEKKSLAPAKIFLSPTLSEEELTDSSSSGSTSTSSTYPSISISNETADSSVDEIENPCTSAILKVLSSGIDVKDKNISGLTLIQNPEIQVRNPSARSQWVRPFVAPLRIVKKKVQPPVVPLEPLVVCRPPSGNWEQAMDDVLQSFRDAELGDSDFSGLFSGDDSFLTQSSEINSLRDDRDYLDNHGDEFENRLEASFYNIDERLSMVIAPPNPVVLKGEDPAYVSVSERAVSRLIMMEIEDELDKVNVGEPRHRDCEGCYSWTAAMDEEDDQWSEKLDLNEYAS